jgi:hypothetical protein
VKEEEDPTATENTHNCYCKTTGKVSFCSSLSTGCSVCLVPWTSKGKKSEAWVDIARHLSNGYQGLFPWR